MVPGSWQEKLLLFAVYGSFVPVIMGVGFLGFPKKLFPLAVRNSHRLRGILLVSVPLCVLLSASWFVFNQDTLNHKLLAFLGKMAEALVICVLIFQMLRLQKMSRM